MRMTVNRIILGLNSIIELLLWFRLNMKCLVAAAILVSFLYSGARAQSAAVPAPNAQQNEQKTVPASSTPAPQGDSTDINVASKVKLDNWQCTLHAARFDYWRFEIEITTLSTYRLQNCPPARLDKITAASAAAQLRTVASFTNIVKGGAHQQIMDINLTPVSNEYYWVSDLKFSVLGTSRVGLKKLYETTKLKSAKNLSGASYVPFIVTGETHYIWNTGSLAHRLVSPTGDTYIMTAYTKQVQPSLTRETLTRLDTMLRLPADWTYENYFLDKTIVVRSGVDNDNSIQVIFDDLNNNYVLYQ